MTPCVLDVAGVHAQLPLQVTAEVKNDAMFAPELHSHWVIYELAAGEVE